MQSLTLTTLSTIEVETVAGGISTESLFDLAGVGNIVADYSTTGSLVAHYVHALGLVSQAKAGSESAFYAFDGMGNTVALTDELGRIENQYSNDPFGVSLRAIESVDNPFVFSGRFGVITDDTDLSFMRARAFISEFGRFAAPDPIGLNGADANAYRYVANRPTQFVDPAGTELIDPTILGGFGSALRRLVDPPSGDPRDPNNAAIKREISRSVRRLSKLKGHASSDLGLDKSTGSNATPKSPLLPDSEVATGPIEIFYYDFPNPNPLSPLDRPRIFDFPLVPPEACLDNPSACTPGGAGSTGSTPSHTPEDKFGPIGYDAPETTEEQLRRFSRKEDVFHYRIDFWNEPTAEVPTQDAIIVDTLDVSLDWSTLEFTDFGFLDFEVNVGGGQVIDQRVDMRPSMNLFVDVTATFDPATGEIQWLFSAVDPDTGEPPDDPFAGFLPPFNEETRFELGWVEYTIEPKRDLQTGDTIENVAFVQFDFLGPFNPAPKDENGDPDPWLNTIDAGAPASQVGPLPPETGEINFTVTWSGSDDAGGSGIANYNVLVSDNGGPFEPWMIDTTETSAVYTGQYGHVYQFYSLATDNVGHVEAVDTVADARTAIVAPGFSLEHTDGSTTVGEDGGQDTVSVVLLAQPTSQVVVTITTDDATEVTTTGSTLTFNASNWNQPQPVAVSSVDDPTVDGDIHSSLTARIVTAESDDAFDLLPDQTLTVTTTDDDVAGFSIVESDGATGVSESGLQDIFTVVLDAQPLTDVVIDIEAGDTTEAGVVPAALTFSPSNWNQSQTVDVTGVDDVAVDGHVQSTITVRVRDDASDDAFDPLPDQPLNVTTTDDDIAGYTVEQTDDTTIVNEPATADTFNVVLDARPLTNVVLSVTAGDTTEATLDLNELTFTPANWDQPQAVTVSATDDPAVDGDVQSLVTIKVIDGQSNDAFDPLPDQTISVTTTDDDIAGVSVTQTNGTTVVDEPSTTDTLSVVLDARPLTNVVLSVMASDATEATLDLSELTFTPTTWHQPQTVTVRAADDPAVDGDVQSLVTIKVIDDQSDDVFDPLPDQMIAVTTTDDDRSRGGDIDLDQQYLPLSDGILGLRFLAGFDDTSLTSGATNPEGGRATPEAVLAHLRSVVDLLDIDGDGEAHPLSDGILFIRYLAGFTGDSLIRGVVNPNAIRTSSDAIIQHLSSFTNPDQSTASFSATPRAVQTRVIQDLETESPSRRLPANSSARIRGGEVNAVGSIDQHSSNADFLRSDWSFHPGRHRINRELDALFADQALISTTLLPL